MVMDLVNLFMATRASGFIGTFTSNWSRMTWEAMMHQKGYSFPHVSLDAGFPNGWMTWNFGDPAPDKPIKIFCYSPYNP